MMSCQYGCHKNCPFFLFFFLKILYQQQLKRHTKDRGILYIQYVYNSKTYTTTSYFLRRDFASYGTSVTLLGSKYIPSTTSMYPLTVINLKFQTPSVSKCWPSSKMFFFVVVLFILLYFLKLVMTTIDQQVATLRWKWDQGIPAVKVHSRMGLEHSGESIHWQHKRL